MVKFKFVKSPTCEPYKLAYSAGQTGLVNKETADLLAANGFGEIIAEPKQKGKRTRESKIKTEQR